MANHLLMGGKIDLPACKERTHTVSRLHEPIITENSFMKFRMYLKEEKENLLMGGRPRKNFH